jgi:hypothetical protein
MVEQGLLDAPMFALWLSPDPFAEPAGAVHFGGHDRARYTGVMHELPVISTKYWTVGLTGARVGGYAVRGVAAEGAIMDSGTSMLTASDADAAAINQARRRLRALRAAEVFTRTVAPSGVPCTVHWLCDSGRGQRAPSAPTMHSA